MANVQIKAVSVKHSAILDYMLVHPAEKLSEVAKNFGVSQAWLSVIVNSDAFQAKLRERDDQQFSSIIVPLREQVMGIAQVGVEKLGECLENASPTSDKQFIADTTDSLLKNLGYSPRSVAPSPQAAMTQNNIFMVDKSDLEEARKNMRQVVPEQEAIPVLIENEEKLVEDKRGAPTEEV